MRQRCKRAGETLNAIYFLENRNSGGVQKPSLECGSSLPLSIARFPSRSQSRKRKRKQVCALQSALRARKPAILTSSSPSTHRTPRKVNGISPHFSPDFYCGGGSGHVYCVALPRAPRRTVENGRACSLSALRASVRAGFETISPLFSAEPGFYFGAELGTATVALRSTLTQPTAWPRIAARTDLIAM